MKIALAVPTYGPTEPEHNRQLRAAIMQASNDGVRWAGDLATNRVGWEASRNNIVASALAGGLADEDAILWIDSDVVLEPTSISQLVAEATARRLDFLTGVYYQRFPPHFPLLAMFDDRRRHFTWIKEMPENVVAPVDGCGFGCVLTTARLLRAIAPPWFAFTEFSEDFDFCLRARDAGVQLHVHTGVQVLHLADPVGKGKADFEAIKRSPLGLTPWENRGRDDSAA